MRKVAAWYGVIDQATRSPGIGRSLALPKGFRSILADRRQFHDFSPSQSFFINLVLHSFKFLLQGRELFRCAFDGLRGSQVL
jgi:hypothetical protein